jgi:hypothetical protein
MSHTVENDARFCSECGVTLDLHYDPDPADPDPSSCESADAKARLMESFARGFLR